MLLAIYSIPPFLCHTMDGKFFISNLSFYMLLASLFLQYSYDVSGAEAILLCSAGGLVTGHTTRTMDTPRMTNHGTRFVVHSYSLEVFEASILKFE